jgi:NAD(P)-dependent dehydrogenase (short-subunit alcohol dehydrogenase family)
MRHSGKRVLVTGAGRGAGLGIAQALADEGASVAAVDIDPETAEAAAADLAGRGVKSFSIQTDVTDETQVQAMFERAQAEFDGLDILVNTVAWIDPPHPVTEIPFENWRRTVSTNLDSVFLCCKHGVPLLSGREDALIVNISSINGTRGFPYRAGYGATKAAIINLTETLAMELFGTGIRVNCLVPGGITGERVRQLRQMMAESGLGATSSLNEAQIAHVMRLEPIQVGRYVAFLASEEGRVINGQALWIGDAPRSGAQALF